MSGRPPLHVAEVGDSGATVAFLHGLFGQGKNFTAAAKALRPDLRSLLVDLPNHGRSPWTGTTDYAATADHVAATLATASGDRPLHVVGHSMGGKVAMLLALRHPDLVDRLVVVDIAPSASDGAGEFEHLLGSLRRLDLTSLARRGDADERLATEVDDARVRGFLLQNLRPADDGFRWQADLDLLHRELGTVTGFPEVEGTFDGRVLWVAGERSPYVNSGDAARMTELFPRTVTVTVKGAGHWVHAEQPEAFVSALRTFLLAG